MRGIVLLCCGLMFLTTACARTIYQPEQMSGYVQDEERTVTSSDRDITIDYDGGDLVTVSLDDRTLDQPQKRRLKQFKQCWTVVHGPQNPNPIEAIFGIVELPFAILEVLLGGGPSPGCRNTRTEWADWENYGPATPAINEPIANVAVKFEIEGTGFSKMLETNECGLAAVDLVQALGGIDKGARGVTLAVKAWTGGGEYIAKLDVSGSKLFERLGNNYQEGSQSEADIAATLKSGCKDLAADVATRKYENAKQTVATLVPGIIHDNSGSYMCPFTQDGTLADWTDMIISAKIGETAGSVVGTAAGAYAGKEIADRAFDNVPFGGLLGGIVGGAVGNKVGKEVGKNLGLEAAGGMENIRKTSDLSFNSLDQMARYMYLQHSGGEHYQEALNAAIAIYPEFQGSYDNTAAGLSVSQKSQFRDATSLLSND
ncbi:MAG: hypothetical protein KKA70_11660 [Proteobacteria bacterium]|nr:hypothetical protein [Pseudomonadota bacterium]